jgi:hypothetical protein
VSFQELFTLLKCNSHSKIQKLMDLFANPLMDYVALSLVQVIKYEQNKQVPIILPLVKCNN